MAALPVIACALLLLSGCQAVVEDLGRAAINEIDAPRVQVDAGGPYAASLADEQLTLEGYASLGSGTRLRSITWTIAAGDPLVAILDQGTMRPRIRVLQSGSATLQVTVKYDAYDFSGSKSVTDTAVIVISDAPAG